MSSAPGWPGCTRWAACRKQGQWWDPVATSMDDSRTIGATRMVNRDNGGVTRATRMVSGDRLHSLLAVALVTEDALLERVQGEEAQGLQHLQLHWPPTSCHCCCPPLGLRGWTGLGREQGINWGVGQGWERGKSWRTGVE